MPSPWIPAGSGGGLVDSVSGTAPVTSTGGVNPVVGITAATDLAPGSLSAADKTKLDGLGTATCFSNNTNNPGLYSCAENDLTTSTGFASHAEGELVRAGLPLQIFTIPAGGTLITIAGDVRSQFERGVIGVRITPSTPAIKTTINGVVNSDPTFGTGNTTFNLAAPIDGVTTGGSIVQSDSVPLVIVAGTMIAGGTLVTMGGDQTGNYILNQSIQVTPIVPTYLAPVFRTVASPPMFAAGSTTFNLSAAVDGTSTSALFFSSLGRGLAAHAEGLQTLAEGQASHAEGERSQAIGQAAHAEGVGTWALGWGSHVEGWFDPNYGPTGPIAYDAGGHAEGEHTVAGSTDAHAEGIDTIASGFNSHAEGQLSYASGASSHAEGYLNVAGNQPRAFTIAAGGTTITLPGGDFTSEFAIGARLIYMPQTPFYKFGASSTITSIPVFAAGNTTFNISNPIDDITTGGNCVNTQVGIAAHVEGQANRALGNASHAEGINGNLASGLGSHVEGHGPNVASGDGSHAEGTLSIASGAQAHAEGSGTVASGASSHSEGATTIASSAASHAEGDRCQATTGSGAHAEGSQSKATGAAAHAEGTSTLASGDQGHAEGNATTASGNQSHSEGFTTVASSFASHAEGDRCQATTGSGAHAEGSQSKATGAYSHAEGELNTASGQGSHAEGGGNTASAIYAHAAGLFCVAQGAQSMARGLDAKALNPQDYCEASGKFVTAGDNQYRRVFAKGLTPGIGVGEATVVVPAGVANFVLENSKSYFVTVRALATKTGLGGAARQAASFHIEFMVDVTSVGALTISAVTAVVAPILSGAAFVGATLVPGAAGANVLALTFTIGGALTIASRIGATVEFAEVLGT